MNPKISITVDSKNKAVATITGMATVGAKIDVEVTGITATDVPSWGSDDDYTGYSLRFRIVDVMGKDLVRYQLNKKTSTSPDVWTCDTTNNKFTATNVDFDTDVLRKAFVGVPYNETLEFGIILDSYVDRAQYAIGKIKIRQWASASTEDPTVLPDWRETLAELKEDLEAVEASKTAAAASATSAASSASSASTSASAAAGSALSALGYQNAAGNYANNAASSATSAGTSATNAAASEANALIYKNAAAASAETAEEAAEEAEETLSDAVHYTAQTKTDSEKAIARTNIGAVAAESGKGLSTNDYTNDEKNKLVGIRANATAVSVSATGTATDEVQYITVNGVEKKLAGGGGEPDAYLVSAAKDAAAKTVTLTANSAAASLTFGASDLGAATESECAEKTRMIDAGGGVWGITSDAGYVIEGGVVTGLAASKTSIDLSEYKNHTTLTAVWAPNVTYIKSGAFYGCSSLVSVYLPAAGLQTQGTGQFQFCTSLVSISLPAVTSLQLSIFNGCTALTSASFPAVTTIKKSSVFKNCPLATLDLSSMTVAQVTAGASDWGIQSGCVVTCSDGTYTVP